MAGLEDVLRNRIWGVRMFNDQAWVRWEDVVKFVRELEDSYADER